jgi:CheY-like chemotaxis protein
MKILVIDDERVMTDVYQLILAKAGHTVFVANHGTLGAEIAQKEKPDMIFLDMLMPEVDGLDFLKLYKKMNLPKTKVIVLSNIDNPELIAAAKKLGANDYLLKADYSPHEIANIVGASK